MKKISLSMLTSLFMFIWINGNVFAQAASPEVWAKAKGQNYETNKKLDYPYSGWKWDSIKKKNPIKKIGVGKKINLIDFWGEGRIKDNNMITGFPDAYNINHQYQLVSNGPDKNRKIPNRIPVSNYNNFADELQKLVEDGSVLVITLMGAPINEDCASEIARMIDKKDGVVIVYDADKKDSKKLETAMKKENMKRINVNDFKPSYGTEFYWNKFFEISLNISDLYVTNKQNNNNKALKQIKNATKKKPLKEYDKKEL